MVPGRAALLALSLICAQALARNDAVPLPIRNFRFAVLSGNASVVTSMLPTLPPRTLEERGGELLIGLLSAWQRAVEAWPDSTSHSGADHAAVLSILLTAGVNASQECPVMDTISTRNAPAFDQLWRASDDDGARYCLTAVDADGSSMMHHAVKSSASGMARVLFRLRVRDTADVTALQAHLALGQLPQWQSHAALRRADIERMLQPTFFEGLLAEARRRDMPAAAIVDVTDARGATPLTVACESGRVDAVVALLAAGARPTLAGTGALNGSTCAHAAASRGYLDVLRAIETARVAALSAGDVAAAADLQRVFSAVDAYGRTPLMVARAHGRIFARLVSWLETVAARSGGHADDSAGEVTPTLGGVGSPRTSTGLRITASEGCPPPVPMHNSSAQRWQLHVFDAKAHESAGWQSARREHLQRCGLDGQLLQRRRAANEVLSKTRSDSHDEHSADIGQVSSVAQVAVRPALGESIELVRDVPSDVIGRLDVCGVDIITTGTRAGSRLTAAEEALITENYISIGKPFILRRRAPRAKADRGVLSRSKFLEAFGALQVEAGDVPYASTYGVGNGSRTMLIRDFVSEFMSLAADMQGTRYGADSDSAYNLPLPRPPYVFDGHIMHASAVAARRLRQQLLSQPGNQRARPPVVDPFAEYEPPAVFGKSPASGSSPERQLRQVMLGSALSGAMPHFHGAAVNTLVFGLKLWVLRPPSDATFAKLHAAQWFCDGPYVEEDPSPHLRFLQEPGDIVFVPDSWGHSVLNLADSFAIAIE